MLAWLFSIVPGDVSCDAFGEIVPATHRPLISGLADLGGNLHLLHGN